MAGQGLPRYSWAVEIFLRVRSATQLALQEWGASCVVAGQAGEAAGGRVLLGVVRPVYQEGRQFLVRHMWYGGGGMHWEALLCSSWQASMHTGAKGVFYGIPPFILSPP